MLLSNIGPAFASEDTIIEQAECDEVQADKPEEIEDNKAVEDKQEDNSLYPTEELETNEQIVAQEGKGSFKTDSNPLAEVENEPIEEKIDLKIRAKLIGLEGREFSFDQIFPHGAKIDFVYMDKDRKTEKRITRKLIKGNEEIDFAEFYPEEIKNGHLELRTDGKKMVLVDEKKDLSTYKANEEFIYEIYQIPNTGVKFRTIDTEGQEISNPNFGKFSYQLKDKNLENLDIARDSSKPLIDTWDLDSWKSSQDSLAKVSLQTNKDRKIEDSKYTYEIIKQMHEDNDFTKPFEVTLIRKEKTSEPRNKDLGPKDQDLDSKMLVDQKADKKENTNNKVNTREKISKDLDTINKLRSLILAEKDQTSKENLPDTEISFKADKEKAYEGLEIKPNLEKSRQLANPEKPGFMETRVVVRVKLYPLVGKTEFDFDKVFPEGANVVLEGECNDCRYDDLENGTIVTKTFTDDFYEELTLENKAEQEIDFGIKSQLYFGTNNEDFEDDDRYIEAYPNPELDRIISDYGILGIDWSKGYPTTILSLKIYQSQNTEIIVKTIDENNKPTANPRGNLTHTIGNENRKNPIPTNNSPIDSFDGLIIDGENYENFNGSKESKVSLDGADPNGFIVDGEYAYKILKQEQENDDKANPLEVTLLRKPLVTTENPNDEDYVKITFNPGKKGTIEESKGTYWVLKGVDLGGSLIPPEPTPNENFKFKNWDPEFPKTNQKFDEDTTFTAQYEQYFNINTVFVQINFHGLSGKAFSFNDIFPKGAKFNLVVYDEETDEEEYFIRSFDPDHTLFDFGIHDQTAIKNGDVWVELDDDTDDAIYNSNIEILESDTKSTTGHLGYTTFYHNIYEIQNTNAIFKTIDKDGKLVDNPSSRTVSYKLGQKGKSNQAIPQNNDSIDMMAGEDFYEHEWEGNYDGSQMPIVSLDNAQNGFIVEGDYAYKILKQEQEDNDKSNPLEVTLIRKQKVIVGGDHPKTTDPTTGNEIDDPDYVKVEFKSGNHSTITGNNPVYWVLKDVDLGNAIKAPDLAVDDGYVFAYWLPYLKENQKYSSDTVHVSEIKERLEYDYLTYSGDTTFEGFKVWDPIVNGINHTIEYVAFVKAYGQYGQEYFKSTIDVDKAGEVRLSMWENKIIDHPPVDYEVWADFSISASKELGNNILASPDKKLTRKAYLLISDTVGNTNWAGLNITIKTQNTKGNVAPEEVSTSQNVSLSKDQIIEAVKKGEFTYNSDVPKQNKMTEGPLKNALHKVVDGKNVLNPDKVKSFEITDEDYNNIDFGQTGQQEVPVTITYLDNSQSTVNVKIKIEENVPTGLSDSGYLLPSIFLVFGTLASLVSLVNFRKNKYD